MAAYVNNIHTAAATSSPPFADPIDVASSPCSPRDLKTMATVCTPREPHTPVASIAKQVFLGWERLRVLYVAALGIFTVMLAVPGVLHNGPQLFSLRGLAMVVEGAVVANICYFAGPAAETYLCWLGVNRKWVRWALFLGGTSLTAFLALLWIGERLLEFNI